MKRRGTLRAMLAVEQQGCLLDDDGGDRTSVWRSRSEQEINRFYRSYDDYSPITVTIDDYHFTPDPEPRYVAKQHGGGSNLWAVEDTTSASRQFRMGWHLTKAQAEAVAKALNDLEAS